MISDTILSADNKVYVITIAYCPAALLARCLLHYSKSFGIPPLKHIVVQGHYPINKKKNNNDIKLICAAYGVDLLDPNEDLGSAQSQNWVLQQLGLNDEDYFINLDPDSACNYGWDIAMRTVLENDPNCTLISCMAPMVSRVMAQKGTQFELKQINGIKYGIPNHPTPFNLSMWRYSFIKEIGGIPQLGPVWGETEAPFHWHCMQKEKYHAYLLDHIENEDGKFIQDRQHNEFKDRHMRTSGDKQFLGNFTEFLRLEYPQLLDFDTCKDLSNHNHP